MRRGGVRAILRALGEELAETLALVRQTSVPFWTGVLVLFGALAFAGLLPLGRFSLYLQCVTLSCFGLLVFQADGLAREFRRDDAMELREREGELVVARLPTLLVLAALPLYLAGQAILFQRVMLHLPGVLEGTGWGDAWRLSLHNLLYTEILLDAADLFHLRLAPDPEHRLGQVLVFVTRALLSLAFIRVLIQIGRAAYFRAHGLGRGVDHGKALERAVEQDDLPGIRHALDSLFLGLQEAIDPLLDRALETDQRTPRRCLHALRVWAIPVLEARLAEAAEPDPRAEALLAELLEGKPPDPPEAGRPTWRRLTVPLLPPAVLLLGLGAVHHVGGWPGLGLGFALLLLLAGFLLRPKASLERGVELGVFPPFPGRHLARHTVAVALGLSLAFLATAWVVFGVAATTVSEIFLTSHPPDRGEIGRFLLANVLRLQIFFSAPDLFALWLPPFEQRPFVGSALTFLVRTALNLGLVAVALGALSVSFSRLLGGSRLLGNDELAIRIEADRGGRFAPELIEHHAGALMEELWNLMRTARRARHRRAVAEGCSWIVLEPPEDPALADLLPTTVVASRVAQEEGADHAALELLERVRVDGRIPHLFPASRIQLAAHLAVALHGTGNPSDALEILALAEEEFHACSGTMVPPDREDAEAELALARETVRPGEDPGPSPADNPPSTPPPPQAEGS
ncbi:MAG: hypothetical protein EA425_05475 [Puniceicoccaceae bacterium]|nr:MAG: hypothetical protein EA425_05475 [Puniceicoccaceae bacterium]